MYVIFDTNIWKKHSYMRSPAAASVRLFLRKNNATIGMPEVVKLEIERHLRQDIEKYCSEISNNHRKLLTIFGNLREIVLPTPEQINLIVNEAWELKGLNYKHIIFDEIDARKSFMRTINKLPPSHKGQQFKDGIIWENCKTLAALSDVAFITDDTAFYQDEKHEKGLSKILEDEIESEGIKDKIRIYQTLEKLLENVRSKIDVPNDSLIETLKTSLDTNINYFLDDNGFLLDGDWAIEKDIFATEDTYILYVKFSATISCVDTSGDGRFDAFLTAEGEVKFDEETDKYSEMEPDHLEIRFTNADGQPVSVKTNFVIMRSHMGHRTVTHSIRAKLNS